MNRLPFLLMILLGMSANSARATPAVFVFNNTANPISGGVFGPSADQVGNQITLGGDARQITGLSWLITSQNTDLSAEIETHIYANDGVGGAPGTLLWSSGLLTGVNVSATDTLLSFAVPNITVPNTITVTSRIYDSTPVALGRVFGGTPSVGNLNASWVETSPGVWSHFSGPWGMQVVAVPEPSVASLMIPACVLLVGISRARGPRNNTLRFGLGWF
jgi:hypothetical protein